MLCTHDFCIKINREIEKLSKEIIVLIVTSKSTEASIVLVVAKTAIKSATAVVALAETGSAGAESVTSSVTESVTSGVSVTESVTSGISVTKTATSSGISVAVTVAKAIKSGILSKIVVVQVDVIVLISVPVIRRTVCWPPNIVVVVVVVIWRPVCNRRLGRPRLWGGRNQSVSMEKPKYYRPELKDTVIHLRVPNHCRSNLLPLDFR